MTLPLLTTLFMMLLTVAAAGVVSLVVSIDTREKAWQVRNETATGATLEFPLTKTLERQLQRVFDAGSPPSLPRQQMMQSGRSDGNSSRKLTLGLQTILDQLPAASSKHIFYHGTWDQRELRFEPRTKHHPLWMERRLEAFSLPGFKRKIFERLVP